MHQNLEEHGTVARLKLGQEVFSQHDSVSASQAEEEGGALGV